MQTSLMDYSIISHGSVCMVPKSLGMAHQLELTLGINLFSTLAQQETGAGISNLPQHFEVSSQALHKTLPNSVRRCRRGGTQVQPLKAMSCTYAARLPSNVTAQAYNDRHPPRGKKRNTSRSGIAPKWNRPKCRFPTEQNIGQKAGDKPSLWPLQRVCRLTTRHYLGVCWRWGSLQETLLCLLAMSRPTATLYICRAARPGLDTS